MSASQANAGGKLVLVVQEPGRSTSEQNNTNTEHVSGSIYRKWMYQ
jgi:hypothetical protein